MNNTNATAIETRTNATILRCRVCKAKGRIVRVPFAQNKVERVRYTRGIVGVAGSAEKRTVRVWETPASEDARVFAALEAFVCTCGRGRPESSDVNGRHNPEIKCGARCRSATTGACECACGGANHGAGHA